MAAAPQYGTLMVATGGGSIAVDVYLSDVANANGNFDSGSGAASTSETFWKSPVNGFIQDFSVATGLTDTTKGRIAIDGAPIKSVIRWANHVNTLANRPNLNIPIKVGEQLSIIQLA